MPCPLGTTTFTGFLNADWRVDPDKLSGAWGAGNSGGMLQNIGFHDSRQILYMVSTLFTFVLPLSSPLFDIQFRVPSPTNHSICDDKLDDQMCFDNLCA
jgi:hypothetical protein